MCPEKMQEFKTVAMSRNTVLLRIKDLRSTLKHQVWEKAYASDFFSIACDESIDATDTAQRFINLRGVDFCIAEDLLDLRSLKGTTTLRTSLKLCQMQLKRWDITWTSFVEQQRMGLQQWKTRTKEWPLGCAPRCKGVEVRLFKCTASSTIKPFVAKLSSLAM
jgi:hypothetical protein